MTKLSFNIPDVARTKPKVYINVGGLLDIPTSNLVEGRRGEVIVNGGLSPIVAIAGTGNVFKSTIAHYMLLRGMDMVVESGYPGLGFTYDTESNVNIDRLEYLGSRQEHLGEHVITEEIPKWYITDKTLMLGNVWDVEVFKKHVEDKKKNRIEVEYECWEDPYTKKAMVDYLPTFVEIDSYSEFEGELSNDMLQKDLEDSGSNTFAMKQGLFKKKFASNLSNMATGTGVYTLLTAQQGEKIDMRSGPAAYGPTPKALQHMRSGEAFKGVSSNFYFLTHTLWQAASVKSLVNDGTKLPEYPVEGNDSLKTDLNIVVLNQLRNKNGPSGCTVSLIVSQTQGVLPSLTEFHFIKESKRYGLEGNMQHYALELYPECKLSRTTVRGKLDTDKKLRRAVNITAEMLQLKMYHGEYLKENELECTPKELYEDIKKLGYDWNILLGTRGHWTLNQYKNKVPYLSTVDLLRMRKEKYVPYFLDKDKKLKKDYEV